MADTEGFISWGGDCVCGRLYTYIGIIEPGQFDPSCPVHNSPCGCPCCSSATTSAEECTSCRRGDHYTTTRRSPMVDSKTRECTRCNAPMVLGYHDCQGCGSAEWRWNANGIRRLRQKRLRRRA